MQEREYMSVYVFPKESVYVGRERDIQREREREREREYMSVCVSERKCLCRKRERKRPKSVFLDRGRERRIDHMCVFVCVFQIERKRDEMCLSVC